MAPNENTGKPRPWLAAKIAALFQKQWNGKPGERFRETTEIIAKFDKENVQLADHRNRPVLAVLTMPGV